MGETLLTLNEIKVSASALNSRRSVSPRTPAKDDFSLLKSKLSVLANQLRHEFLGEVVVRSLLQEGDRLAIHPRLVKTSEQREKRIGELYFELRRLADQGDSNTASYDHALKELRQLQRTEASTLIEELGSVSLRSDVAERRALKILAKFEDSSTTSTTPDRAD